MVQEAKQLSLKELELDPSKLRTTVRFTPKEYQKILEDSEILGQTLPTILKAGYFGRLPTEILMTPAQYKEFVRIYRGVANNLNQLTKNSHLGRPVPESALRDFIQISNELFVRVSEHCV